MADLQVLLQLGLGSCKLCDIASGVVDCSPYAEPPMEVDADVLAPAASLNDFGSIEQHM
jgi:hypothetical protein